MNQRGSSFATRRESEKTLVIRDGATLCRGSSHGEGVGAALQAGVKVARESQRHSDSPKKEGLIRRQTCLAGGEQAGSGRARDPCGICGSPCGRHRHGA
jgi:hypothetical protein